MAILTLLIPDMKMVLPAVLPSAALLLSCSAARLPDETLEPMAQAPSPPGRPSGSEPWLRTGSDFYFFPGAGLQLNPIDGRWAGGGVVPGDHTVVTLSQGGGAGKHHGPSPVL